MRKRFDNITELNNVDILNIERVINMNAQPSLPTDAQEGEICFFNSKLHIYSNGQWRQITQSFTQDVSGLNLTQNGAYIKLQPDSFGGCRVSMRGNGDSAEYSILANKTGFGQYGTGEKLIIENFTGNVLAIKDNFIGISEIEPQRELHITSSFGEHMRFDSIGSSQYQNKIEFYRAFDNNNDRRKIAEISCHRQLDGGFFQIQTRQNNGSLNSGIFLDCSNNLGINKTNPAYTLDVSGNLRTNNLILNKQLVINNNIEGRITYGDNSCPMFFFNNGSYNYGEIMASFRISRDHLVNIDPTISVAFLDTSANTYEYNNVIVSSPSYLLPNWNSNVLDYKPIITIDWSGNVVKVKITQPYNISKFYHLSLQQTYTSYNNNNIIFRPIEDIWTQSQLQYVFQAFNLSDGTPSTAFDIWNVNGECWAQFRLVFGL